MRRFDAPEALDTRFHEVRAKSALNRVPERSRMPFRVDGQPVSGLLPCVHLLRRGRHAGPHGRRPDPAIADLARRRIYGTVRRGPTGATRTEVLDHWSAVKPAYRVTLEDGTELIASGDHRFLTGRGWKHVDRRRAGAMQRPHLTLNNKLMGTGRVRRRTRATRVTTGADTCAAWSAATAPRLALLRAAGRPAWRRPPLPARADGLRGAPPRAASTSPTSTSRRDGFQFAAATARAREMRAIRTQARAPRRRRSGSSSLARPTVDVAQGLPRRDLRRRGLLRRRRPAHRNTDPTILDWTHVRLRAASASRSSSRTARRTASRTVRSAAGSSERLRFFHLTDPAITRKRTIEGTRAEVRREARASSSIEPLGDRAAALRHHHRHGRLHRQRRRQPQLLRPPDARVPRPQRGARLRAARSSSRSTCPRCCGRSWRGRRGRASTSRWARTPTRTSGSRAATS